MSSGLVLGTAQWGMPYGIANRHGQPSGAEVDRVLQLAQDAGVRTLDTARAYGDSEAVIGERVGADRGWRIVTKLDPDVGGAPQAALDRVEASVARSLRLLRRERLDVLLLHRWHHRHAYEGALWDRLRQYKRQGVIGRLGMSAANPQEAMEAAEDPEIEVMQVATSLLDQRLVRAGFFHRAEARHAEVFVRSAYLQGVVFLPAEDLPSHLRALGGHLQAIQAFATEHGRTSADVCISFVKSLGCHVVVGCETASQLAANLRAWRLPPLEQDALRALARVLGPLPDEVVDPSRWRLGD